ncbi:hypothetical protein ACGRH2_01675 [Vibrio barjaei]|jgi:CO dehydrogenase/acetyl-CoA synthase beta subunit|uniref:Uncharacterized protein n=1 Tax=Vibrio barjaei TaxID=1676683 RepID=A0ABW7ICY1_9VIBR
MKKLLIFAALAVSGPLLADEVESVLGATGRVDAVLEYCYGAGYFNERDYWTMKLENNKLTMMETKLSSKDIMHSHSYLLNYRNHVSHLHQLNDVSFKGECAKSIQIFTYALLEDDKAQGITR